MTDLDTTIFEQKTVLFVDDEPNTRIAMNRMLSKRFKEVWLAENGSEALKANELHQPDIVITDIEMPVMNGLILLEKLKTINPDEPVMIITAFADEAHQAQKADAVLIKPINRKMLFEKLLGLLQK